uniref:Uncharacterized protein n=1 Tax=Catagonus wagneri TaxID=51154 RepID=A0A8C3YJ27_9CETA
IYFLTVLEARSLKSRCQQSHTSSETLSRILSSLFLDSDGGINYLHSFACSCITPISTFCHYMTFSLCVLSSSYKDATHMRLKASHISV